MNKWQSLVFLSFLASSSLAYAKPLQAQNCPPPSALAPASASIRNDTCKKALKLANESTAVAHTTPLRCGQRDEQSGQYEPSKVTGGFALAEDGQSLTTSCISSDDWHFTRYTIPCQTVIDNAKNNSDLNNCNGVLTCGTCPPAPLPRD